MGELALILGIITLIFNLVFILAICFSKETDKDALAYIEYLEYNNKVMIQLIIELKKELQKYEEN